MEDSIVNKYHMVNILQIKCMSYLGLDQQSISQNLNLEHAILLLFTIEEELYCAKLRQAQAHTD